MKGMIKDLALTQELGDNEICPASCRILAQHTSSIFRHINISTLGDAPGVITMT